MRFSWRTIRWSILFALVAFIVYAVPGAHDTVVERAAPIIIPLRQGVEKLWRGVTIINTIPFLIKENGALKNQVTELQALAISNNELKHENELLRKELNLGALSPDQIRIPAQVISRSSAVSLQSIIINKGSSEGFVKGMAVVAQGYLIGRVDEVLPHTCKVTLLSSADSLLPVVLQDSRSVGLLKGSPEGLIIDEVPRDVTIGEKEAIVTSNLGDVVKSGIPVGNVSTILSNKSDVFQSARIVSPIDFSRLEVVFGLKP